MDHERHRVRQVWRDPVIVADIRAAQDRAASDGTWGYGTLVELQHCAWMPTRSDLRDIAGHLPAMVRRHGLRGPAAIVARPDSTLYGLLCAYAILAEHSGTLVQVFADTIEAEEWLNAVA